MPNYTPGPWVEDETCIVGADGNAVFSLAVSDEYWGVHPDDYPEAERARIDANSHLARAAPELLEALNGVVTLYVELANSGDAGFWDPETVLEIIQARAARAKALGEQST